MGLDKGICLRFYKRKDVQAEMIEHAKNKEIGVRYGDGFGKRPDILSYPRDVLELALRDVTSFHASEEVWGNPLELSSNISKKELDELRTGWDLVLDIDCPDWEISKLTAYLFIKALKDNEVKDVSCKFSGNKGFHIGVPFEAFPKEVAGKNTNDLFPECPKKISLYLLSLITNNYITIKNNKIIFDDKYAFSLNELKNKFGEREFLITKCLKCKKEIKLNEENIKEFICSKCENRIEIKEEKGFIKCDKCHILMEKIEHKKSLCKCGSNEYNSSFDPLSILEIDTILISSRHLYRMPYSLHEKSALVSLPIDPNKVMEFEKNMADPDTIQISKFKFLDRNVTGESARRLLVQALDFEVKIEEDREVQKDYEELVIESPIKEEFFPPCMQKILEGIEDGRKRAVFILMNFLGKIGWNKDEIKAFLLKWNNEKNREPLRDNYIFGQLSSFKPGDKLPPNCNNDAYYQGIGMCLPNGLCKKIKNPVNYTIVRWKSHLRENDKVKKKKTQDKNQDKN